MGAGVWELGRRDAASTDLGWRPWACTGSEAAVSPQGPGAHTGAGPASLSGLHVPPVGLLLWGELCLVSGMGSEPLGCLVAGERWPHGL